MPNSMRYCQTCRFQLDNRGFTRHTLSVVHKKGKLIRAMLERDCITHAEIARRIGVTRERVRQLALQMGFADGRSRHAICRMERRRKEMAEFFVEAQKRGFAVELLGKKSAYKKLAGFRQTTFNPEESEHLGTASSSHHYRQHIARWSLLGRPRRSK
jgi:hypothetical protein